MGAGSFVLERRSLSACEALLGAVMELQARHAS